MADKKVVRYKLIKHKWPDERKMERDRRIRRILIVVVCLCCFAGGFLVNSFTSAKQTKSTFDFEKLNAVYDIMKDKFYFGKDQKSFSEKLMNGAITGMVDAGGDSHTEYMLPSEAKEFNSSMEGSYVGIGVQYYSVDDNTFMIDKVFKGSPAQEAGLQSGDLIYAINGKVCKNMDTDQIKSLISGKAGTRVKIEIVRDNKHIVKEVKRKSMANTVTSEKKGDTGIVTLSTFADTSGTEFGEHMKDLSKDCKNLVIDLRNNGGGYLIAAQEIASYLVPKGSVIFKELDRNGKTTDYRTLQDEKKYSFQKIVILVNENTASAAEVLTEALRDNKKLNTTIVGEQSYGKGTVQTPITFKDNSYLKYTIAKWLTPAGKSIDKVGITPDVKVDLDPAITTPAPKLKKEDSFKANTVNVAAQSVQTFLKFLGYPVDRVDAYFSPASSKALQAFQHDNGLPANGEINAKTITALLSKTSLQWHSNPAYDTQMVKAMEIANGS